MFRQPRIEVPKLRQSAKGGPCHLQTPACNGNWETVVLCHPPNGSRGMKADDPLGVFGCSDCHNLLDLRTKLHGEHLSETDREHYWYEGTKRQIRWWWDHDFIGAKRK